MIIDRNPRLRWSEMVAAAAACLLLARVTRAQPRTWTCPIPAGTRAEICPLKYGKAWAYSVEIDDGPTSTLTVVKPLLDRYEWNDAPAGQTGGTNHKFVGTAAIMFTRFDTGNPTFLNASQCRQLQDAGWHIVNHSYWHSGNHWDPTKFLKPADFRRELFWSQALDAELLGGGRATTHFVYPNGDFHYEPFLKEFGLLSASRVGGSGRNLNNPKAHLSDWDRNWLDEGVWAKNGDALMGLKEPKPGDFIIDFTHGINEKPDSDNQKRWVERLTTISTKYGPLGDNSMWVAPSDEIANYMLAAGAATVNTAGNELKVTIPDSTPASALTVKLTGLPDDSTLPAPTNGTIFRQGSQAWITTPVLGQPGTPPPSPRIRRVYSGEVKNITFEKPARVAGVRFLQAGATAANFKLQVQAILTNGARVPLTSPPGVPLEPAWGLWRLVNTLPDTDPNTAVSLEVNSDRALQRMEVWIVAE